MIGPDGKRRYKLEPILIFFVIASIGSYFVSMDLFMFVGGFTAVFALIWLITVWDDIVIWWSTRKHKY